MLSQQDAAIQATAAYINQLKERVDESKMRKELAMRSNGRQPGALVSGLEVTLISGVDKNSVLSEAISILKEEGAEAVCASVSIVGDKVFHTFYAQV
ncbi:hypothetical protein ACJRO7_009522 [Eucalyptus globulus]|uniref:Uncharacterized protein n=1 Tax=Eucalyptus globulus TaxID=34317 RepID=A0ABD3L953_EUCGL